MDQGKGKKTLEITWKQQSLNMIFLKRREKKEKNVKQVTCWERIKFDRRLEE